MYDTVNPYTRRIIVDKTVASADKSIRFFESTSSVIITIVDLHGYRDSFGVIDDNIWNGQRVSGRF